MDYRKLFESLKQPLYVLLLSFIFKRKFEDGKVTLKLNPVVNIYKKYSFQILSFKINVFFLLSNTINNIHFNVTSESSTKICVKLSYRLDKNCKTFLLRPIARK